MSPLVKYWIARMGGFFVLVGSVSGMVSDRVSDPFKAILVVPAGAGLLVYFLFAQRIAACPDCHSPLRERITMLGVIPYPTCQSCGRDLRLSASRAAVLSAKSARPPR